MSSPLAAPTPFPTCLLDVRQDVLLLLREFEPELRLLQDDSESKANGSGVLDSQSAAVAGYGEAAWLAHIELKFVLRALRLELLRAVGRCMGAVVADSPPSPLALTTTKEALSAVEDLLFRAETREKECLAATDPSSYPVILRLAQCYGLSASEKDLFQLLFLRGASKSSTVRAALGSRQDDKLMAMELCGMSVLEVEDFLDDKRTHMSEGIIVGQDDYELKSVRMTNEAVSVLMLRPLKTEQRLKLSKTELLNVMESLQSGNHIDGAGAEVVAVVPPLGPGEEKTTSAVSSLVNGLVPRSKQDHKRKRQECAMETADDDLASQIAQLDELAQQELDSQIRKTSSCVDIKELDFADGLDATAVSGTCAPAVFQSEEDVKASRGDLTPYSGSLEYLDDAFQVLALMLRIAKARHKEDLKEACNNERPWYDVYRTTKVSSIRELRAKLRFVQNRLQERMKLTEQGLKDNITQLPRLEALARKLELDEFEKGVVVMLTGVAISPVVKSIFESENGDGGFRRFSDTVQVKDILTVYFDSFKEQVLARTYFYKSSKLVARGLIKFRTYVRGSGDLMDQQVELDRRMLDWIVGLDTEMNELVEGSHLYKPKVSMEQVVLPNEQKEMLLMTVNNFSKFRQFRKRAGLEDLMSYGSGLVVLLCGPSGTGKTMTVNAVAHHLGKRVLLVDFHSLQSVAGGSNRDDHSADLRGLFRDADMNDAVIFFDECEAIFAQREQGGDRMLNTLLTEMERHEGIIMLATNRPLDLDEAMHRRITCVSEFHPPDHTQRHKIWKIASERLPVADDIDWEKIALRYELTGGFIKNALVSALLLAISRDSINPTVIEDDIVAGCRLQMRGSLQMKSFNHRVVPKTSMDELVLSQNMRERLGAVVNFEKARAVLLGQWGFQQECLGTACFFWGSHGTGKSAAAEAIGFELGRPLKVINCAQLISKESSTKTGSNICSAFKDARLMDAVLVLEDFQIFNSEDDMGRGGLTSVSAWSHVGIGLLLHELERFPGICILIANVIQGGVVHRLDQELLRRLKFVVEFKMPDQAIRSRMWKKMIPDKAPLASDVDFEELGRCFDFASGAISGAVIRAAAKAALRSTEDRTISQKDLVDAAKAEREHFRDEFREIMLRAFI